MAKSTRVPELMKDKFERIRQATDAFSDQYLNEEYKEVIRLAIAALCRKRPSPLLRAQESSWAAGIVHAIGTVNFLFDKTQNPYCNAPDIYTYFGVSPGTGQSKSREVRDLLKINSFSPEWTLPSKMEDNPMIWLLRVNGLLVDIRHMPLEAQEIAFNKGLIPYIPGKKPAN